jgi:hypothetical protein
MPVATRTTMGKTRQKVQSLVLCRGWEEGGASASVGEFVKE